MKEKIKMRSFCFFVDSSLEAVISNELFGFQKRPVLMFSKVATFTIRSQRFDYKLKHYS